MTVRPLKALLISEDRLSLRQLSRFLDAFGYDASQAATTSLAIAALQRNHHDFLVFDADPTTATFRESFDQVADAHGDSNSFYSFLMVGERGREQIVDALEAGVDDFLEKPINFGELLARLRAGARVLEHRRRTRLQECTDRTTGLPTRLAFRRQLHDLLQNSNGINRASAICVAFNLDYFGHFRTRLGEAFAERALATVAKVLMDRVQGAHPIGCGDGDQFFAALANMSESEGVRWAEQLCRDMSTLPFETDETTFRVTASIGVAGSDSDAVDGEELLQRSLEAQRLAKSSGRDCVFSYSQLLEETSSWAALAAPGKLFEQTVARDVMTPCTVVLRRDEQVSLAQNLFRYTQLSAVPIVDAGGNLVGHISQEDLPKESKDSLRVRDILNPEVPCLDEETSFASLMDFFTANARSHIFIVRSGRPTGLVTRNGLASLSEPLNRSTFTARVPQSSASEYLAVCDTMSTETI